MKHKKEWRYQRLVERLYLLEDGRKGSDNKDHVHWFFCFKLRVKLKTTISLQGVWLRLRSEDHYAEENEEGQSKVKFQSEETSILNHIEYFSGGESEENEWSYRD